jgi:predicted small lipoprotein YifL
MQGAQGEWKEESIIALTKKQVTNWRHVMKKLLILALAFVLTGCGALAPAATPTAVPPTATPVVLVQTVEVTVIPTQGATAIPTVTPAPTSTPQVIVVTATGGAAAASTNPTAAATQPAEAATATLPANVGGQYFTNLTRSGDLFYLRCQPDTINFGISTSNPYISEVDLFYRTEDRLSTSITDWKNGGKMVSDKNGNFTLAFTSAMVAPDFRTHRAWFDYEFVGVNKYGDAVGRTARISQQITYKIDCTD